MTTFIGCLFFMLGLLLGTFFNVIGLRVPNHESIIFPGLHGYCKQSVSGLYLIAEAVTGVLFLWIYLRFGLTLEGLVGLILVSLAVIISISDLKYMLIPNKILLFFLPLVLIVRLFFPLHTLWNHLIGAVIGGLIILLIFIFTRGGMGLGDAKLFFICGWIVGFPNILLALFIACLIGTLVGGILLILKIVKRKQPIPFGPFLALGTILTYGYGSDMVQFYLAILDNGL
jgi:leader peptidase (prepilin peptidase)/N-methyltransferase